MSEPGRLLAAGRDSEIFEHGPRLVLRRSRNGRSLAAEARTMEHVRAHGYPVPAVESISDDGTELVMERIDGPSMVEAMSRRPWTLRRHGAALAGLHRRLHDIPAPEWLPSAPVGRADAVPVVHLDLHPLNVIVGSRGPVVIDWANARRGEADVDVALAWALIASGDVAFGRVRAAVMGRGRSMFLAGFLRGCDVDAARRHLAQVVEWKVTDPHMSERECAAMRALAASSSAR